MFLSVVIPTFNSSGTIERLLDSVFSQDTGSRFEFEVILVDGGSGDSTVELASSFRTFGPDLLVETMPGERCVQRNFGISRSRGDFILYLDSDMVCDPGLFGTLFDLASSSAVSWLKFAEYIEFSNMFGFFRFLERCAYIDSYIDSPRFIKRELCQKNQFMVGIEGSEDWYLDHHLYAMEYSSENVARIPLPSDNRYPAPRPWRGSRLVGVIHDERDISFWVWLTKKVKYAPSNFEIRRILPKQSVIRANFSVPYRIRLFVDLYRTGKIGLGYLALLLVWFFGVRVCHVGALAFSAVIKRSAP